MLNVEMFFKGGPFSDNTMKAMVRRAVYVFMNSPAYVSDCWFQEDLLCDVDVSPLRILLESPRETKQITSLEPSQLLYHQQFRSNKSRCSWRTGHTK